MPLVAHISSWGVPCGIAKHLSYWLQKARAGPYRHIVFAEDSPAWYGPPADWNTVEAIRCWRRGRPDTFANIARPAEERGVSLIHLQYDPTLCTFEWLLKLESWATDKGIPIVATMHNMMFDDMYVWQNKLILRIADQVVVGTPVMAEAVLAYAARFGLQLRREPRVIPLPAPKVITSRPKKPAWRVLTWGFLSGHKGHTEVYEAVRSLRKSGLSGLGYCVSGHAITGEQRERLDGLIALAEKDPLMEVYDKFCTDDKIMELCAASAVIVLNHRLDVASSSGSVVLSVASGSPVVVSDSPMFSGYTEPKAVLTAGKGQLAGAILDVLNCPEQLDAGRKEVLEKIAPEAVAREYEEVYHGIGRAT